ncbi:MAG: radical SAM family heme chaperone HemW [Endomicrobium sp.]|jgi:oxygen-independent coproporphyrinogen-3 oxidase|nr:radical SAM family heme chaperone HemW [Endomicrobium sp.]
MIGLYIHIPFCRQKCFYCDFFSSIYNADLANKYIDSLIKHFKEFKNKKINSIYIGGGTPSVLSYRQIQKLLSSLNNIFNLSQVKEFTFELNPESVSKEKLQILKEFGVTRLSIGLQSVEDQSLKYLGRVHDYKTFCIAYNAAKDTGFNNINIDLIYGLPNQTIKDWKNILEKTLQLDSQHLSLYPLSIEKNTPFYKYGVITCDKLQRELYDKTTEILDRVGYIHYEISNWAKKNKEAFHNTNYWRNLEYIGLGAGACGYLNRNRYKNIEDIEKYINFVENNLDCAIEKEYIDEQLYITETIILGLRLLSKGLSIKCFKSCKHKDVLLKCLKEKTLIQEKDKIKLSKEYIFVSNQIISRFIV